MKKYRIKRICKWVHIPGKHLFCPTFSVQMFIIFGVWLTIKSFTDPEDPDFARREAEELLDKLNEK